MNAFQGAARQILLVDSRDIKQEMANGSIWTNSEWATTANTSEGVLNPSNTAALGLWRVPAKHWWGDAIWLSYDNMKIIGSAFLCDARPLRQTGNQQNCMKINHQSLWTSHRPISPPLPRPASRGVCFTLLRIADPFDRIQFLRKKLQASWLKTFHTKWHIIKSSNCEDDEPNRNDRTELRWLRTTSPVVVTAKPAFIQNIQPWNVSYSSTELGPFFVHLYTHPRVKILVIW